jgi:signal transduction histidine kinase
LSYLLHPPFLDETGLLSALRWYAVGFAKRSGVEVELELPESFEQLGGRFEITSSDHGTTVRVQLPLVGDAA